MDVEIVDYSSEVKRQKKRKTLLSKIIVVIVAILLVSNVAVFSFLIGRNVGMQSVSQKDNGIRISTSEALGAEVENNDEQTSFLNNTPTIDPSVSPSPTPNSNELVINSDPALDGFWTSLGVGSSISAIQIGRNDELVSRGFLTFELEEIPEDARITQARLMVYKVREQGDIKELDDLMIDHLIYGDTLDTNDYSSVAMLSSFAQLEEDRNDNKWLTADVTRAIINDLDSTRPYTQLRIHFSEEVTSESEDFIYLESGEDYLESGNEPRLIITYQ